MDLFRTDAHIDRHRVDHGRTRGEVGEFLLRPPLRSRRASPRARREDGRRARPLQRLRALGRSGRHALHAHGYRAAATSPAREDADRIWGRGACDAKGIIASMIQAAEELLGSGVAELRPAVRGRRGEEQRRGAGRRPQSARVALPDQRRAERQQAGARLEGRAALRDCGHGQDGALRLPGTRRVRHRQAAGRARGVARHAAAGGSACSGPAR